MKINLLFIAKDTSTFLNRNNYFLEKELSKITNFMVWRESGNIQKIIKALKEKPDFILISNDIGNQFFPIVDGLDSIDIPTGLMVHDSHRFVKVRRNFIEKNNINFIFTVGKEPFTRIYPEYKDRVILFPHHVNTNIFKDYGMNKDVNLMMLGSINKAYPLRQKIFQHFRKDPRFVSHQHPGFRNFTKQQEKKVLIGENYAKEINRTKLFFTCGSKRNYAVIKYFEIPASNTLLLAPTFKDLEDMGFIPGVHFVDINEKNFAQKANYYLKHEEERKKITKAGYDFVHQNHSTESRAAHLKKWISKIMKS